MFASSHLEDLNMKYTVNTNKNKIQVNWGKGAETILLVLMEKQSSCPSLLMRLPVLARNHTYTLKQSHWRLESTQAEHLMCTINEESLIKLQWHYYGKEESKDSRTSKNMLIRRGKWGGGGTTCPVSPSWQSDPNTTSLLCLCHPNSSNHTKKDSGSDSPCPPEQKDRSTVTSSPNTQPGWLLLGHTPTLWFLKQGLPRLRLRLSHSAQSPLKWKVWGDEV